MRRQYRFSKVNQNEDTLVDCTQDDFTMLDKMIFEEQLESLGTALERLPDREREIILLRFYYQYTSKQVAALMKISHENVRYLQHTAIGKLKKMMEKQR